MVDQLWKLDDNTLTNKEGLWQSDNLWEFEGEDSEKTKIYVINRSKSTFLFVARPGSNVIPSDQKQLWIKGTPDNEGYFTLKDVTSQKYLTVESFDSLQVKGKS